MFKLLIPLKRERQSKKPLAKILLSGSHLCQECDVIIRGRLSLIQDFSSQFWGARDFVSLHVSPVHLETGKGISSICCWRWWWCHFCYEGKEGTMENFGHYFKVTIKVAEFYLLKIKTTVPHITSPLKILHTRILYKQRNTQGHPICDILNNCSSMTNNSSAYKIGRNLISTIGCLQDLFSLAEWICELFESWLNMQWNHHQLGRRRENKQ